MPDLAAPSYDAYARQRLFRILSDLIASKKDLNWSTMADAISEWNGPDFQRNNFYRLRDGKLSDPVTEIIVRWLEQSFEPDIRQRLSVQSIFGEMGLSARDYYFHVSPDNLLEELDEQILEQYAGVYLCAPAYDKSSFLPLSFLREWYRDYKAMPHIEQKGRTLDIKQYIAERSILVLQRTSGYFFYAAEIPMSALFPKAFETGCIKMTYEGVGVVSSNSIQIKLRECLSRVPKTHAILINKKTATHKNNPFGLSFYLPPGTEGVRQEWQQLPESDIEALKKEYALSLEAEYYLSGPVQVWVSPVPYLKNLVGMVFGREHVYHRKPADFLRDPELHFIRPDVANTEQFQKVIDNPLSIGELL